MEGKASLENICNGCRMNGCVHRVVDNHCVNYEEIKKCLEHLEELKKVMTILAKKAVNMMRFSLTLDDTNYYYNLGIKKKYQLTQEEYDLLKRYFKNE